MGWHAGIQSSCFHVPLLLHVPFLENDCCNPIPNNFHHDCGQLRARGWMMLCRWPPYPHCCSCKLLPIPPLTLKTTGSNDRTFPFRILSTCDYSQVHSQWRRHEKGLKKVHPLCSATANVEDGVPLSMSWFS